MDLFKTLLRVRPGVCVLVIPLFLFCVSSSSAQTRTYTLDADFDEGTLINVNHDIADQLQLNSTGEPFEFIWVAASARGTIVKIDTRTGVVLGEFWSSPANMGRNPSRTTVDANGNVWSGNRDEATGGQGSVVQIGLKENGQCVDRHGPGGLGPPDGVIQTSTGLGTILPWTNAGGVDTGGGVSTAVDECIIKFVRVNGNNIRHVSVDGNNNVWTGGHFGGDNTFDLLDNATGAILATFDVGVGGYGGLVDGNGILWASSRTPFGLLRYDTKGTITTADDTWNVLPASNAYGLGIDSFGNIWHSQYTNNAVDKRDGTGLLLGTFTTFGATGDRGVTVTPDDDVWIANSWGSDVSRLTNAGAFVTAVGVGTNPTGVAVDAAGKVWATNMGSSDVSRIDPGTNLVDLTVSLGPGAAPYNYSDMTGATLTSPPTAGTWEVVYDSGILGVEWGFITWTSLESGSSVLAVQAASSTDGITFGTAETVAQGVDLTVADGQYLKVTVTFSRASPFDASPILYDLTIVGNRPPVCDDAYASPDEVWPPNHEFVDVTILGITDPDGDPITIVIDGITQDEPVDTHGDGSFVPDGEIVSPLARVRAERMGGKAMVGNGRVYEISFTASDGVGGECIGTANVCVPHSMKGEGACVDDGQNYDSLDDGSMAKSELPADITLTAYPNPFNPSTQIAFTLASPQHVSLHVFDVMGRSVATLLDESLSAGSRTVRFDASGLPSGTYVVRLLTDSESRFTHVVYSQ
jgi:streptogramin lyase